MIISIISDQTDPPLSGVITSTVFGPNTFSASETSWLIPLIDVIFVDIQTPLGKNIFDTIHFFSKLNITVQNSVTIHFLLIAMIAKTYQDRRPSHRTGGAKGS